VSEVVPKVRRELPTYDQTINCCGQGRYTCIGALRTIPERGKLYDVPGKAELQPSSILGWEEVRLIANF